ncbi:SAF domain-containing protein [Glutamicibacter sp. NPDC090743]|uniref:SAF domain-containing protein n=1 Tax=Glutamicibacter sp. NPDC090743 TaxID=3364001 RepID=UPI00383039E3
MTAVAEKQDPNPAEKPEKAASKKTAPKKPAQSTVATKPRKLLIASGVLLAVLGAMGAYFVIDSSSNTTTVVAVNKDIARGHVIEGGDLSSVQIPEGQPIPHVAADDARSLLGKSATLDIPTGSILNPSSVADGPAIPGEQSMVGLSLTGGKFPGYPLRDGDPVRLVVTPPQGQPVTKDTEPSTYTGTVASIQVDEVSGNTIVSVLVPRENSAVIATAASANQVALVLDGGK